MTKRHLLLFALLLTLGALQLTAQTVPQGFNYQCIVRDANGASMNNQTVTLLFTVRSGTANGPVNYSETQTVSTNEFGLVNLVIGQGNPLQGTFGAINWGNGAKFLTVSVETAPNVFDELGSTQLMSVPYALHAQNAANGADNWGTQVVQVDPTLAGNGTSGSPLGLAPQGAQTGQVLKWDGTKWLPQDDISDTGQNGGTVTQINTGPGLTGGPITTSGTISLENTSVAPGVYGGSAQIPVITVDQSGRITDVFTVVPQPSTVGITGAAGINVQQNGVNFTITNTGDTNANDDLTTATIANGDVTGPFSDLQIKPDAVGSPEIAGGAVGNSELANNAVTTTKIADQAVTSEKLDDMGASSGQVLKWTGTEWAPAIDNLGTVNLLSGTGINVTGTAPSFTINNTGDTNAADDITTASQANGDVAGPFSDLQIKANAVGTNELNNGAVTGAKIAQQGAANGQVLKWNGTTWAPAADITGSVTITGGVGIDVIPFGNNDFTIANSGDINPFDDITENSVAGGDLTGTFDNLQIKPNAVTNAEVANNAVATNNIQNGAVTGAKIAQQGATNGQVLKWNGTTWAPAADNAGGDNWGAQVAATNATITGNGTLLNPLGIAQQGATSGQVLKWNGTAWTPAVDDAGGDNWGAQVAATNATITGNGTLLNPLGIAQQGATSGQVLKWNGTAWAPAVDDAGGDNWGTQFIINAGEFEGKGTVAEPLELAKQGATPGQVLKWNGASWSPEDDNDSGGDDWGAQTAVTGAALSGNGTAGSPLNIAQQGATNGQVLKWNGTAWIPQNDSDSGGDDWGAQVVQHTSEFEGDGTAGDPLELAGQGASNGQVLKWNGASWAPEDDNDSGGDDWGAQTAVTGAALSGNGTAGSPLNLAQQGATSGQVLKWNGTAWIPQNDSDSGGDDWGAQVVQHTSEFEGDGTAGDPLELAGQGASNGQVLKWNGASWAPEDDNDSGGDDWGAQTAVTGAALSGNGTAGSPLNIAQQGATSGQVLKWNGTAWAPQNDNNTGDNWGAQTAVTGAALSGNGTAGSPLNIAQQGATNGQVLKWNGTAWAPQNDNNTGDNWGAQTAVTGAALSGNGTAGSPLNIAQQGATNGQVLKWNGTAWAPQDDSDSGGDDWGAQTVEVSPEFGGNGTPATPLALAQQGAATGQVLKWNGTAWTPADDLIGSGGGGGNTYFAGTGISITGTAPNLTISNTGDLDETNELQTLSLSGNDLTLSDGGGTVTLPIPVVNNYSAGSGIDITGAAPNFTIVNTGDADSDPSNELQSLSLSGSDLTLSDGGGTVTLPPSNTYNAGAGIDITGSAPNFTIINTGDADNDPVNEIQSLSLTGNDLSLSNGGGTVTLPADNTYSAGPGISITGTAPNLTINNTGDADNDPANELQNLSLNGTLLKITGTNSAVSLDTVLNSVGGLWIANGNNISNTNSGNVGVGTTTPAAKFHVKANGQAIRVEGDNAQIAFAKTGGGPAGFIEKASDYMSIATIDSSSILLTTANAKSLFIDGVSGNVGIGDHNTGDAKLAVYHDQNGGFLLQNNVGINWEFVVAPLGSLQLYNSFLGSGFPAGTFAPNGIYTPSDRRLKKDINALPGVLDKVKKLKPVSYRYLPEKSDSPLSIGFLAQDVQSYFPELITENASRDGNTYLGLNYAGFGVLAVKAVQEQQEQIESLTRENDELRRRLNLLESRMDQLLGQAKK